MKAVNRRALIKIGAGAAFASLFSEFGCNAMAEQISSPLTSLTLGEASRRMHRGEVTSLALTQAFLNRISRINPSLNAFITVMSEEALTRARAMDAELRSGTDRGPLHGLPIVLKDNIDIGGTRTTAGSQVFDDNVPEQNAYVVQTLLAAGAIILGKCNMHEFAMGRTSATSYFGPVHNPWAFDHVSGGSSGGCAVAIITDMCLGAIGTDTGGSARMPAAYCSTVGLKPTYGLVSTRGVFPLSYSMDHCGPMAKTTEDAAILLNAMVAYDRLDIASVEHPAEDYVDLMRQPVDQLRIGVPRAPFFDKLDPQIDAAVNAAITVISRLTAGVRDVAMPATNGLDLSEGSALNAEMVSIHRRLLRYEGNGYSISIKRRLQDKIKELDNVSDESAAEKVSSYIDASRQLALARRTIDDAFSDFELIIVPTMRVLPPKISDVIARDETTSPKAQQPTRDNNCSAFNIWGIPAISIPCGFSHEGLPIGLMIAGPRFSEGRVLALAHAYEQATHWHKRRPVLRSGDSASSRRDRN